ncbi:unnamed protein product [Heterobilharzia americana]|nr:unnamed protein product [Heterobilharzia americana]
MLQITVYLILSVCFPKYNLNHCSVSHILISKTNMNIVCKITQNMSTTSFEVMIIPDYSAWLCRGFLLLTKMVTSHYR